MRRPYEIVQIPQMGSCLVASEEIEEGSLLCEYKGELKQVSEKADKLQEEYMILERDKNGKLWGVFSTRMANEARYISGISKGFEEKANCDVKRLMVDGIPRAFVRTIADIKAGDILYIDYGDDYPQEDFIYVEQCQALLAHLKNTKFYLKKHSKEFSDENYSDSEEEESLSNKRPAKKVRFDEDLIEEAEPIQQVELKAEIPI
mmetsp:Transcript_37550/g.27685  ORF Transcript_37550/g.27685 Transcript_37550/m.27685 type:complete len:204 (-) Transcript_37550:271-882(-)